MSYEEIWEQILEYIANHITTENNFDYNTNNSPENFSEIVPQSPLPRFEPNPVSLLPLLYPQIQKNKLNLFLLNNEMTTVLPTLELEYNKETTSNSTNTNIINNNIIIKPTAENIMDYPIEIPPEISTNTILKKSDTPEKISEFKEAFIAVPISYFKNNVVLLNNFIELSDKIITKIDDLRYDC
jgi:hypothetical protein